MAFLYFALKRMLTGIGKDTERKNITTIKCDSNSCVLGGEEK